VVLKAAVMDMVERLQGVVRFGFGAFTGEQTGTGTGVCPMFDKVDAALNNRAAIATLYDGLGAPVKGETPTAQVLGMVRDLLAADPAAGPKYILLVTDGQPDYCNDGNPLCPIDGVVHQLQRLSGGGINTLVFGVQSALAGIPASTLQAFANAGAGQPVMQLTTLANDVYFQCQAMTVWLQQHQMLGRAPMEPLGIYASGGGTATVYSPDPTNPQAVADLFAATVAGVKSCTFDLVDGLRVDLAQIDRASVIVGGVEVARDAANGWSMASETRLVLAGSACTRWRMPDVRSIDFRFPCGVVHTN
jgi:hypothetical protein